MKCPFDIDIESEGDMELNELSPILIEFNEISQILRIKKQELIGILPQEYKEKFERGSYICGGCIYSLANGKEPNDYDFFLRDKDLARELMDFFKSQDVRPFKNILQGTYNDQHLMISKYAISIGKFQIITKYIGEPKDVVNEFDFMHNMFYFENDHIYNIADWEYLKTSKVTFNDKRARDISGVILRIPKFVNKGMIVSKKEIAKMLKRLQYCTFDENEQEIIENQFTY